MFDFLDAVKGELRPDQANQPAISLFTSKIQSLLDEQQIAAKVMTGGSVGKGTYIKGNFDVDVFVLFSPEYESAKIADLLAKVLQPLQPLRLHGSRDYFQIHDHFLFEIIPVLAISSYKHAQNVTDMSPLHVDYVKSRLLQQPQLADEIRLAKQFCKAKGVYGAESYIKGFSGHVLDILVIHYGSFVNFLSAVETWKDRQVIDPALLLDNPEKEINPAKRISPLILVDPLQPDRNAAAALSREKYDLLKKEAGSFLAHPSPLHFVIRHFDKAFFEKKKKELNSEALIVVVTVQPLEAKADVAGAKVMKAFEFFKKSIKKAFPLIEANWEFHEEKSVLYAVLEKGELSDYEERQGPPLTSKKFYQEFLSKHHDKRIFVKNKRIFALIKRDACTIEEVVHKICADPNFLQRIRRVTNLTIL